MKKFFRHVAKAALLSLVFFGICAAYSDPIVTRFFISSGFIKLAGNPSGTWEASRIPAFAGGDCTSSSGTVVLTCAPFGRLASPNTWAQQQTFSQPPIFSTLTGYLKGNGSGALSAPTTIPNSDITGLGTASTYAVGVNGATIPLLNGNVTFSGNVAFSGTVTVPTPSASGQAANKSYVDGAVGIAAGRKLLNTLGSTTTTAASLSDTTSISASYSEYEIDIEQCAATASGNPQLQVQVGGAFKTTGYATYLSSGTQTPTQPSTYIPFAYRISSTAIVSSMIRLSNPLAGGVAHFTSYGGDTSPESHAGFGYYTTAGNVTGLQFLPTAGTFNGCTIKIYGLS